MEQNMSRQTVSKAIKEALPKMCCNCGTTEHLTYHHIVPIAYGGRDILTNVAVLCSDCHSTVHYGRAGVIPYSDAIKEGIAKAKERGVHVGKPCADYDHIMQLIAKYSTQFNNIDDANYELHTETEIRDMAGVKPVCYAKCKRMLIDAMESDVWPYDWEKPKVFNNRPLYDRVIKKMRGGSLLDHQKVGALNG